jgi:hypothetical protein
MEQAAGKLHFKWWISVWNEPSWSLPVDGTSTSASSPVRQRAATAQDRQRVQPRPPTLPFELVDPRPVFVTSLVYLKQ